MFYSQFTMLCYYLLFIFLFICFANTVKSVKHQNNNDSSLYLFSTYSLPRLSLRILYVLCNIYIKFMMCDFIYISISSTYLSIYLSIFYLSVCLSRLREAIFQLVSSGQDTKTGRNTCRVCIPGSSKFSVSNNKT